MIRSISMHTMALAAIGALMVVGCNSSAKSGSPSESMAADNKPVARSNGPAAAPNAQSHNAVLAEVDAPSKGGVPELTSDSRLITIGDSITDGNTYPRLIGMALHDAGKPTPTIINAGVANDESAQMLARLDDTVFRYHPTAVTLSAGVNDVLHRMAPAAGYEQTLDKIVARMKEKHVPMILLTCTPSVGNKPKTAAANALIEQYNKVIHKVAAENDYPVAEVYAGIEAGLKNHEDLYSPDGVHPNLAGQRIMARAVLDALGDEKVAVPADPQWKPVRGLLTDWKVRSAPAKSKPLTAVEATALKPNGPEWKAITVPVSGKLTEWKEQCRAEGFMLNLPELVGKGPYYAVTTIHADSAHPATINIGGMADAVFLDGRAIYQPAANAWTGYHYGKNRINVQLKEGDNEIVVETSGEFILGVTKDDQWGNPD